MQDNSNQIPQGEPQVAPQREMPPNDVNERQLRRSSEAFLDMAANIPGDALNQEPAPQPAPQPEPQPAPQPALDRVEKSRVKSGLNLGPKYLEALEQLDSINDTKAIAVQLPMSLKDVEITAITGAEEQALKTATVSPEAFLKKLNELLYNHTNFIDGYKPTFNEFLIGIFPPDKSTLIWGLLSSSYVVLPELERTCSDCGQSYIIKSVPKELIHQDTFKKIWDQPMSPQDYTIKQEVFGGFVNFEFGIPNERDRLVVTSMIHPESVKNNIAKEDSIMSQLDTLIFFTRSITVGDPGDQTVLTDLTQDIYPFIRNLSPKAADGIRSEIDLTIFDDYMPTFYIESECRHCGASQQVEVDVELTFFRKSLAL